MEVDVQTIVRLAAYVGGGLAMGLGAIGAAIGEGYTAAQANLAVSRDPKNSGEIFKNMLVGQAVAESASIFALVIAILLLFLDVSVPTLLKAAALFGAGISMGFGAIGSGIGSGYPGGQACAGIARQPAIASQLTTNMLIGSAVCQTPAIFSMVVALMLMFINFGDAPLSPTWAAYLGAGISMGLAAIGSGYGGGLAAGASCEGIARQPKTAANVTTIMLVGQAVSQTPSIFGLLVSFIFPGNVIEARHLGGGRRRNDINQKRSSPSYGRLRCLSGRVWRVLMRSDRLASWSRPTIAGASNTVVWGQHSSRNSSVFRRRTNG